ncbi:MAG: hypothetical protein AAGJ10_10805 [Bacteroidota bacterium]
MLEQPAMTQEMQTAVARLQQLPESDQVRIGGQINAYLNKLENVRRMVKEGLDSGPPTPLDADGIIRRGRARLAEVEKKSV